MRSGEVRIDTDTNRLILEVNAGADLRRRLVLVAGRRDPDGRPPGTYINWPEGTIGWFTFQDRSSERMTTVPIHVEGPYLLVSIDADQIDELSRRTWARLWLQYPEDRPFVFAAGEVTFNG